MSIIFYEEKPLDSNIYYGLAVILLIVSFIKDKKKTKIAIKKAWKAFENILPEFLVVILLVGFLLAVLNADTISKIIGSKSGWFGVILASVIGSAAVGPLYGAFPVAAVFMKKGVKFMNLLIFIGAWSTTKIPMFLFEIAALGSKFAITRLLIDISGIIIIAFVILKTVSKKEVQDIYEKARMID